MYIQIELYQILGATTILNNSHSNWESFERLLQAVHYDPLIKQKIVNILKMDSYPRRIVLSNWLEQLRRKQAPEKLIQALSCLFDDNISKNVLALINNHQVGNT